MRDYPPSCVGLFISITVNLSLQLAKWQITPDRSQQLLMGCLSLSVSLYSPKKSREGNCDDGEHQSIESAEVVRVPAEEIGAEEHPQHVDGIVVGPPGGTNRTK